MNLTDEDVREILKLLDESPYDELKLETERFKLTLRRGGRSSWLRKGSVPEDATPHMEDTGSPPPVPPPATRRANGEIREVRPPMPGTFYRAPSPGAEPFTEIGRSVAENTILGLVETMKLMNSVIAGCRGEVIEICAENGAPVDVEDVLMRIRLVAHG